MTEEYRWAIIQNNSGIDKLFKDPDQILYTLVPEALDIKTWFNTNDDNHVARYRAMIRWCETTFGTASDSHPLLQTRQGWSYKLASKKSQQWQVIHDVMVPMSETITFEFSLMMDESSLTVFKLSWPTRIVVDAR